MDNLNINDRLLNTFSKRADVSNYMMPDEGAGGSRPLPNWYAELKKYMEDSIAEGKKRDQELQVSYPWQHPDILETAKRTGMDPVAFYEAQERALERMTPDQREKYRTKNYDVAAEGMGLRTPEQVAFASPEGVRGRMEQRKTDFANQAIGVRTPEQAAFASPEAIAARRQDRPVGANGLPGLSRQDLERNDKELAASGEEGRKQLEALLLLAEEKDRERAEALAMGGEAVQRFEDDQTARAMGDEAIARFNEAKGAPSQASPSPQTKSPEAESSLLARFLNPTGNQMTDYGIYGGLGALLGGGLGTLLSSKENRLRNALLFALLGGGLGLGGKYIADKYQAG